MIFFAVVWGGIEPPMRQRRHKHKDFQSFSANGGYCTFLIYICVGNAFNNLPYLKPSNTAFKILFPGHRSGFIIKSFAMNQCPGTVSPGKSL